MIDHWLPRNKSFKKHSIFHGHFFNIFIFFLFGRLIHASWILINFIIVFRRRGPFFHLFFLIFFSWSSRARAKNKREKEESVKLSTSKKERNTIHEVDKCLTGKCSSFIRLNSQSNDSRHLMYSWGWPCTRESFSEFNRQSRALQHSLSFLGFSLL